MAQASASLAPPSNPAIANLHPSPFDTSPASQPNCPLNLLPREIRDQIYQWVLSPTGRVVLSWRELNSNAERPRFWRFPPRRLFPEFIESSLLRTCRQMREELRGKFWAWNALVFNDDRIPDLMGWSRWLRHWENLRHVELHSSGFPFILHDIGAAMPRFYELARDARLETLHLKLVGLGTMSQVGNALDENDPLGMFAKTLRELDEVHEKEMEAMARVGRGEAYRHKILAKSWDFFFNSEMLSLRSKIEWFKSHPPSETDALLKSIHEMIRGDVYMDGILCYSKGKLVHSRVQEVADMALEELRQSKLEMGVGKGADGYTFEKQQDAESA